MKIFKTRITVLSVLLMVLIACQKEPIASFTASLTATVPNTVITFTNLSADAAQYEWNFGDGTTSEEKNPTHSYTKEGSYTVTLYAYSKNGKKSNSASQAIIIGSQPLCIFSYAPKYPKPGEIVHFTDNSGHSPTSWLWMFGDGTSSVERNPDHIFTLENRYNISLSVSNNYGSNMQKDSVLVLNETPVAPSAEYTYTLGPNLSVSFMDGSAGSPNKWLWIFGDGATSILQNPIHRYEHGGPYRITLRAFNLGGSQQITKLVNLPTTKSEASFIYSEGSNYEISFIDRSTADPLIWEWSFGDGSSSVLQNPMHQYPQAGTYNLTLKVANLAGISQITQAVYVSNYDYSILVGNYNVFDQGIGNPVNYTDNVIATSQPNKFSVSKFCNYSNGSVYFLLSGTTVSIPSQTVHCGTPPNDMDHTFFGNGYIIQYNENVTLVLDYTDFSSLGTVDHRVRYNKIKG